jgi:hypothetical protein
MKTISMSDNKGRSLSPLGITSQRYCIGKAHAEYEIQFTVKKTCIQNKTLVSCYSVQKTT